MSKIFIKTNEKKQVVYRHEEPFHEKHGLDEEYMKTNGYIIEKPSPPELIGDKSTIHYYDEKTNTYYYEYRERPQSKEEILDSILESFSDKKKELAILLEKNEIQKGIEKKVEILKEECTNAIHTGFYSNSIGKSFGFNEHDQNNFTQQLLIIVAAGGNYTLPIKWKALDGSVNELTSDQFQALIGEATAHKISNQEKFWALEQQLLAATTKEEIIAIEW